MNRYTAIHCLIWNDDKFPFCSDDCQLATFHMMTTPMRNPLGLYKTTIAALAAEKRWEFERYQKAFDEAFENGFVKYDEKYQVVFVPNHIKYNPPANPNVVKSWGKVFREVPNCKLKDECYQYLKEYCKGLGEGYSKAFAKAFAIPSSNGMRIPEPEPEPEPSLSKDKQLSADISDKKHFTEKVGDYKDQVLKLCEDLKSKSNGSKAFNPYAYVQSVVNNNEAHPQALIDTLQGVRDYWGTIKKNPWGYANQIFNAKNPHYREARNIQEHEDFKVSWDAFQKTPDGQKIAALIAQSLPRAP